MFTWDEDNDDISPGGRDNGDSDKLLHRVAFCLHGMDVEDLSSSERRIADLLINAGYLAKELRGNGEWTSVVSPRLDPS